MSDSLTTRKQENGIGQLHDREVPQVAHVHAMTRDAQERQPKREAVDEDKEQLGGNDGVDEPRE